VASGLTPTGLVIEAVDDIRTSVEDDLRATFFKSLPLGDKTALGHLVGILSNFAGLLWERLEEVNSSFDRDKATDAALRARCLLTGTLAQPATPSVATLTLCGTPTTVVNAGSVVGVASSGDPPTILFDTRDTVTITALAAWSTSTNYAVGARVTANARCYQCITTGLSANIGSGPSTTGTDIIDGTVHWEYAGEGTGAIDVLADCTIDGPTQGTAGDITAIQSPASGWSSARNLLDAELGTTESTDEELRLLAALELEGAGGSTKDALRADILRLVKGVVSCTVFMNITDLVDANGLPPHSFETLVRGGDVQAIVDVIADNQPEAIATYSSLGTSGTHVDSEGVAQTIYYTRPTDVNMYAVVYVNYDVTQYPDDGDDEVKTAITTWGAGFPTDRDVDPTAVGAQPFAAKVPGVTGVPQVLVYNDVIALPSAWLPTTGYVNTPGAPSVVSNDGGRAYVCITSGTSAGSGGPTGVGTDITDGTAHWRFLGSIYNITARQLARFDSTRITVVSTAVAV
jgi:uncharacterized phage protein gp47/JayE